MGECLGKSLLGRRRGECKGPGVKTGGEHFRNDREASATRAGDDAESGVAGWLRTQRKGVESL